MWNNVEDSLPNNARVVLIIGKPIFKGALPSRYTGQYVNGNFYYQGSDIKIRDPLFWMEFPDFSMLNIV